MVNFKFFAVIALFTGVSSASFAYDGDVYGGYDGNFTRYAFIQQASDINLAGNVLRTGAGQNVRIEKLFPIGEEDVDEEDVQMLNDLVQFISQEYNLENGDAYSYMVKRGQSGNGVDGWIVFSHLNSNGWFHYMYYFLVRQ
jgi:hypothetical protein